jgi:hypothetical protein
MTQNLNPKSVLTRLEALRQQVQALEFSLDDPMVINWLSIASMAICNAQQQLHYSESQQWAQWKN